VGTHSYAAYHGDGTSHGPHEHGHGNGHDSWHPGEEGSASRPQSRSHEH
jgi:hypothetical protein